MTRDELDAATDEQLNVMAAKVMGWVWHERLCCWGPPKCTLAETRSKKDWLPATDIADAWELVLRLRKVQMRVMIVLDGDRTICDVTAPSGRDSRSACHASDARAITTAALLAWEAKEKA